MPSSAHLNPYEAELSMSCRNANDQILAEPATPGTPGASKRSFSPEKKTPRGRPRKFSTAQMMDTDARRNLVTILPDEQQEEKKESTLPKPIFKNMADDGVVSCKVSLTVEQEVGASGHIVQPAGTPKSTLGKNFLLRQALSTPRRKYQINRRCKEKKHMTNQAKISQLLTPKNKPAANLQESGSEQ